MEHSAQDFDHDIDPDNNFFSNVCHSDYYSEEQFNYVDMDRKLSLVHFNCRSMYANFDCIKEYLHQFTEQFNIIALTETWLNGDRGVNFNLEGYDLHYINRVNKSGGGVAIFIDHSVQFAVIEDMSFVIDDVLECVSIEICNNQRRNTIITCVYRTPGSSIEVFNNWIETTFSHISKKSLFICGDFNIDLLNTNRTKFANDFLQTMYCFNLHPLITKPTRITQGSASLIDNIFTNDTDKISISGILISDISDHLPVFTVYNVDHQRITVNTSFHWKRVKSPEALDALKNYLFNQNWGDENCPVKQFQTNVKQRNEPWITKGIKNACKKKNKLYCDFIRTRTSETETRYKKYKNKLTSIIRCAKKDYYYKVLKMNTDNGGYMEYYILYYK